MTTLDKYSIILDDLDFAAELINIKIIKHSNITVAMYIVFSRIQELFSKEISNIIIFEYEKVINNIIANEAEILDDNTDNECPNFIHSIRSSFIENNYEIQNNSGQELFIFYDKKANINKHKLSYSSLRKILSIIIQKESMFFKALKDLQH